MMRCFSAFVFVFQHQAKGPRPVGFSDVSIVNFKTIGKLIFFLFFSFSGMRVEGVFARRCVYVPNRLQPFATVRNRSQPFATGPYGRAYGKFCKGVTFGGFKRRVVSFRLAVVALRDIQTCFVTC